MVAAGGGVEEDAGAAPAGLLVPDRADDGDVGEVRAATIRRVERIGVAATDTAAVCAAAAMSVLFMRHVPRAEKTATAHGVKSRPAARAT